jgi:periplasmic protein TonB
MYRSNLNSKDKGGAVVAVLAVHVALLLAFLNISGRLDLASPQSALRVFDINEVEPPPPPPPPSPAQRQKPKEKEGGSVPRNIKSEATPVVAPPPRIETTPVPTIAATETPRQGTAPTQGASDVRGPGTGAGGVGTGTGAGGAGTGPGGGGEGLAEVRTRLITPSLRGRDFPRELLDQWPRGAWVYVRFRVDANGYVMQCIVDRGTGVAAIDSQICSIARARFRFRPALNRFGQPVADWAAYGQEPPR